MKRGTLSVPIALVVSGCAAAPPAAEPSAVSVSPPPAASSADTQTSAPEKSDVPDAPWRVTYHDGSGNDFQFDGARGGTSYAYSPVTPEQSSSGTYSGGAPASGTLADEQVVALWKHVLELEAATAEHTKERGMGTGAFVIVTPTSARTFLVKRGDLLRAFDEFTAPLKKAQSEHPE